MWLLRVCLNHLIFVGSHAVVPELERSNLWYLSGGMLDAVAKTQRTGNLHHLSWSSLMSIFCSIEQDSMNVSSIKVYSLGDPNNLVTNSSKSKPFCLVSPYQYPTVNHPVISTPIKKINYFRLKSQNVSISKRSRSVGSSACTRSSARMPPIRQQLGLVCAGVLWGVESSPKTIHGTGIFPLDLP